VKIPSADKLVATFRNLTREQANLMRQIAHASDDATKLANLIERYVPITHAYARRCHSDPYDSRMWRATMTLHALDQLLGTYGVEAITRRDDSPFRGPSHEYLNAGDTYATTLVYYRDADALRVGCWGDIVERDPDSYE